MFSLLVQLILQLVQVPLQLPFSMFQLSGFALDEQKKQNVLRKLHQVRAKECVLRGNEESHRSAKLYSIVIQNLATWKGSHVVMNLQRIII